MEYIKIYENFLTDYKNQSDQLENKYADKINKSLLSILNKLESYIIKEGVEQLKLRNGSDIYLIDEFFERSDTVVSIYSRIQTTDYLIFEKNKENNWFIISDGDSVDDNGVGIEYINTYRKVEYIENLIENFSIYLNADIFFKMNK